MARNADLQRMNLGPQWLGKPLLHFGLEIGARDPERTWATNRDEPHFELAPYQLQLCLIVCGTHGFEFLLHLGFLTG